VDTDHRHPRDEKKMGSGPWMRRRWEVDHGEKWTMDEKEMGSGPWWEVDHG